jgi:hypothetical protein
LYFAHQKLNVIIWINADSGLDVQMFYLASLLFGSELDKNLSLEDLMKTIYSGLQQRNQLSLIVWDNVESEECLLAFLPSRSVKKFESVRLQVFSLEEVRKYVVLRLGEGFNLKSVDNLARCVGSYPLALAHACGYISNGCCTIENYPKAFYYHQLRLFSSWDDEESQMIDSVKTSIMLSLTPTRRNEPESWKLLQSCVG